MKKEKIKENEKNKIEQKFQNAVIL